MIKKILRRVALTVIVATATLTATAADAPRYVFYFIGDGMGMGPVMSALTYKRLAHPDSAPLTMTTFPVAGFCQTWSASTPVTDSAAAGTALSCGTKTKNGMLGMGPDTVSVTSMARILKDNGWGVGVITTVAPDDATPGAFYAHVPKRSMYYDIDIQAARSDYDFLAGAALRGAIDKKGKATDVMDELAANNVKVVYGPAGIKEIGNAKKVLLLGDPEKNSNINDVSYTIDSVAGALNLPMMTEACLAHLERNAGDRFFMMAEGGTIDHALHANDGGTATKELLNFDEAIAVAYRFYLEHPDETLIVVTADHDTGGLTVGNKALSYMANPALIDSQRQSKEAFSEFCKSILKSRHNYTWDDMREHLGDMLGFWNTVKLTDEQTAELRAEFDKTFQLRDSADEKTLYASFNAFAVMVYKIFNDAAGFGFTTTSHTGNPVPVFAIGVGADMFKGLNNNIEIPTKILELLKAE